MGYTFKKYTSEQKKSWNDIQEKSATASFLSDLKWIDFKKSRGTNIDMFVIEKDRKIVGNISVEIHKRKISKHAYSPYGPVLVDITMYNSEFFNDLKNWTKKYCEENNLNSFKFDPRISKNNRSLLENSGFTMSLSPGQAIDIWVSDIKNQDEKSLLSSQNKDTRYEIKKARKRGVQIRQAETLKDVEKFTVLMEHTMERKGFLTYPRKYYIDQWEALSESGFTKIWLAEYEGKIIAGALMNYYKSEVNYAFGGSTSDRELQKLSAPYYLHFEIMKDAAAHGFEKYNFWGVVPKEVGEHAMRGLSDFKMKFTGKLEGFVGQYEYRKKTPAALLQVLSEYYIYRDERY